MQSENKYEFVGRFIYGYQRVLGTLEHFCRMLDERLGKEHAHQYTLETRFSDIADPAAALLTRHYGGDSLIAREFLDLLASLRAHDSRLNAIVTNAGTDDVPDDAEIADLLNCQPKIDRISQLINAA